MTHSIADMPEKEVFRRAATDATRNVAFIAVAVGIVYWVASVWHFAVTIAFWGAVVTAVLQSMHWTVTTASGIVASRIARKQGIAISGAGWLWLGSAVRGVELALLWVVVVVLRGW